MAATVYSIKCLFTNNWLWFKISFILFCHSLKFQDCPGPVTFQVLFSLSSMNCSGLRPWIAFLWLLQCCSLWSQQCCSLWPQQTVPPLPPGPAAVIFLKLVLNYREPQYFSQYLYILILKHSNTFCHPHFVCVVALFVHVVYTSGGSLFAPHLSFIPWMMKI